MKYTRRHGIRFFLPCFFGAICAAGIGCGGPPSCTKEPPLPRELRMTTQPPYHIEPSDFLIINTLRVVPKPPYHVAPLDQLVIQVEGTVKEKEIWGLYTIDPSGNVELGIGHGTVNVDGMTIEEAKDAIQTHLSKILTEATVRVSLGKSRSMQQITGIHLVRMDGTLSMGLYGSVYVANMTIPDARKAIEDHLSKYVLRPELSLDVYIYNSKWYYVIEDRAGYGKTVMRMPITGRETVLDALSNMRGTFSLSSNRYMWLARPNGKDPNNHQIFPINWPAITKGGSPATNYQLLPGDRIYVDSNPLMKIAIRSRQLWMPFMTNVQEPIGAAMLMNGGVSGIEGTSLMFRNAASTVLTPGGAGAVGVLR